MSICGEDDNTREMTAMTEPAGKKDETYHWFDTVKFLVEDVLFKVSQYPFHVGSKYFVEKYGLSQSDDDASVEAIELKGVTVAQFRVFKQFLFPAYHLTSTSFTFTKDEWLTILTLSTLWHFHDARKLAIQHLGPELSALELINVGRACSVPAWVLSGYKSIIARPRRDIITADEANAIGHETVNQLWTIRYQLVVEDVEDPASHIECELDSRFDQELCALKTAESEHKTKADIEREEREAEEARRAQEEAKAAAERENLLRLEEERRLEEVRLAEQRKQKQKQRILEEEYRLRAEEEERLKLEERKVQEEEKRQRDEVERLEKERLLVRDEERRRELLVERERIEHMRLEGEKLQRELEELQRQEEEARLEERRRQDLLEQEKRENEARERRERQRRGKEERDRQSKSGQSFGNLWGGKASSLFGDFSAESQQGTTDSAFGWGGYSSGLKKRSSTTSLAKPTRPPLSKQSSRVFDQGSWGIGIPGFDFGTSSNNFTATNSLFGDANANLEQEAEQANSDEDFGFPPRGRLEPDCEN
ncbi:hypothetical protein NMY22_g5854 [Coprinellus aureogranulatus]|nr:hypothetical protein NMY22_g5854 [Coprinellus aureogranulatus]